MNMARYDWRYETEPEPHLDDRRLHTPRGKVLGGSSSINGLVYIRGNPLDFDRWEEEGAARLGLPGRAALLPARRDPGRGRRPLSRRRWAAAHLATARSTNPLYRAWIEAGRQAGYPVTEDVNGFQQEGFGRMDMTVHEGRRWSAANAYLRPRHAPAQPRRPHRRARHRHRCSKADAPPACAIAAARQDEVARPAAR